MKNIRSRLDQLERQVIRRTVESEQPSSVVIMDFETGEVSFGRLGNDNSTQIWLPKKCDLDSE